jgi:hypothetical protein
MVKNRSKVARPQYPHHRDEQVNVLVLKDAIADFEFGNGGSPYNSVILKSLLLQDYRVEFIKKP